MKLGRILTLAIAALAGAAPRAAAQRADENVVRAADDAFGVQVGNDKIGLYNDRDVRGFSPVAASNVRVEGIYFDMRGNLPTRLLAATQIKVGLTAQGYAFPAPTGIVDYQLKSIGEKRVISVLAQQGPNEGYSYEGDAYIPLDGRKLGLYTGGVIRREEPQPGLSVSSASVAAILRWRPNAKIESFAFYGHYDRLDGKSTPLVFTSGAFLPPQVEAMRFSQDWAQSDLTGDSYGAAAHTILTSNWTLHTGVFRYFQLNNGNVSETYLNTDANGLAGSRRFSQDPENKLDSYSGEARLTGVFTRDRLRHTVHVSARTRAAMRTFGGAGQVTLGPVQIGAEPGIIEPTFLLGAISRDDIKQSSIGVSYALALRGVGEISAGVQKIDYTKTVTSPIHPQAITKDAPLVHNLALAVTPTEKLTLYASFARGLEDANTAPDIAANAGEAPPAIRTTQWDGGIRYALTPRVKLIAGYFRIEKPYFNRDTLNIYRQLGLETHEGVEISLAGAVTDQLNIVAGAVLMDPKVTGDGVTSGQIGPKPVGQTPVTVRFNADYRVASVKGLSVDAAFNYAGARAASLATFASLGNEQLKTDDYATIDLGMRYRFKMFEGKPATLRVQALNVTDEFAWQVGPSGAFNVSNPRAFQASLAVDF